MPRAPLHEPCSAPSCGASADRGAGVRGVLGCRAGDRVAASASHCRSPRPAVAGWHDVPFAIGHDVSRAQLHCSSPRGVVQCLQRSPRSMRAVRFVADDASDAASAFGFCVGAARADRATGGSVVATAPQPCHRRLDGRWPPAGSSAQHVATRRRPRRPTLAPARGGQQAV